MNLRLTQGDENHSDFPIMILKGLDVVFDCDENHSDFPIMILKGLDVVFDCAAND
jgi:hypothetical protein